jgi:alcohol dehydrogenase class IV
MKRYNYPTTIYTAENLLANIAEIPVATLTGSSGPALLVTDNGLMQTDVPAKVQAAFRKIGVETAVFSDIETNPEDKDVEAGVQAYRDANASFVIGLGGGSPLDVAKTISMRLNHPGPLEQYDDLIGGDALMTADMPPVIAIPTTAGTGSEVSRSSVIHIKSVDRKVVLFSPRMMPVVALLDASLTVGLPQRVTAWTGIDALTHLVEAYCSTGYDPMSDGIALEGIRLVFRHLREAVSNGRNLEARHNMLVASMMGAVAFQKGLGAAHSMAHPLSSVAGLHHGYANALVLTSILDYNADAIGPERFAAMSRAAAPERPAGRETFMEETTKLLRDMEIPESLKAAGVTPDQVEPMVELAIKDGCHGTNPRPMTVEGFRELFTALV